ncbi:MAG: CotH kinase family protein, partial [Desulfobacterales bacterium]|nr:CotH kinase family protein [Desulfobacterales bacterium]
QALAAAAREPDSARRWTRLGRLLDVDRFISYAAMEVLVGHRDGYCLDRNNYRIYHDPGTDRLVYLPHGMDMTFSSPNGPMRPRWSGATARALLETPEGERRYWERLAALSATVFKGDKLQARLSEQAGRIRAALEVHDHAALEDFETTLARLRERVAGRAGFVEKEVKRGGKGKNEG